MPLLLGHYTHVNFASFFLYYQCPKIENILILIFDFSIYLQHFAALMPFLLIYQKSMNKIVVNWKQFRNFKPLQVHTMHK